MPKTGCFFTSIAPHCSFGQWTTFSSTKKGSWREQDTRFRLAECKQETQGCMRGGTAHNAHHAESRAAAMFQTQTETVQKLLGQLTRVSYEMAAGKRPHIRTLVCIPETPSALRAVAVSMCSANGPESSTSSRQRPHSSFRLFMRSLAHTRRVSCRSSSFLGIPASPCLLLTQLLLRPLPTMTPRLSFNPFENSLRNGNERTRRGLGNSRKK